MHPMLPNRMKKLVGMVMPHYYETTVKIKTRGGRVAVENYGIASPLPCTLPFVCQATNMPPGVACVFDVASDTLQRLMSPCKITQSRTQQSSCLREHIRCKTPLHTQARARSNNNTGLSQPGTARPGEA